MPHNRSATGHNRTGSRSHLPAERQLNVQGRQAGYSQQHLPMTHPGLWRSFSHYLWVFPHWSQSTSTPCTVPSTTTSNNALIQHAAAQMGSLYCQLSHTLYVCWEAHQSKGLLSYNSWSARRPNTTLLGTLGVLRRKRAQFNKPRLAEQMNSRNAHANKSRVNREKVSRHGGREVACRP